MKTRIREIRFRLNLSQSEMGEILGLSKAAICQYEKGNVELPKRTIAALCSELNVNREWLETGKGDMFIRDICDDDELRNLVNRILSSGDELRKKVLIKLLSMTDYEWTVVAKTISIFDDCYRGEN